jgi:hypothetical protein
MKSGSCKAQPIRGSCRGERPPQPLTLESIVDRYIRNHRPRLLSEMQFYASRPDLRQVIEVAALGKRPDGKRHPHQSRIPKLSLLEARDQLFRISLKQCSNFMHLHSAIKQTIGPIHGIGPLTIYDTALRIGAFLRITPDHIFLHAGTRQGGTALGVGAKRSAVSPSELPPQFQRLEPREIEDCLCIYKGELADVVARLTRHCH